jgi:ferredoxin, 2Fe-2S
MGTARILRALLMMITVHLIAASGQQHTLQAKAGRSLMQAAVDAGIEGIAADCGGCLSCATCHVMLSPAWAVLLPPPSKDELAMLEMTAHPAQTGSRLSCQLTLTPELNGLNAQLPVTQY